MKVIELISKEDVLKYKIINAPEGHIQEFAEKLESAIRLGNEFKSKVSIVFNTTEGPKRVETTVWNASHDFIELKGGIIIPVQSVLEVEY